MKEIKHMNNAIEEIAKEILDISSLETTNSGEDFHERAVWVLKAALEDAWCCGYIVGGAPRASRNSDII